MTKELKILAIDTSCDDTSVAVTCGYNVLSNVISSQIRYHKKFGGVVPFLAKRLHQEKIDSVIELALSRAGLKWSDIEALAVTVGPGLAPALEIGVEKSKLLSAEFGLPIYAINHMEGHISSCLAQVGKKNRPELIYPALSVLVSGGHTEFIYMPEFGKYELIGATLDDALGEAYDKVSKMLNLGYPGGKIVSKMALEGDPSVYELPIPMRYSKDYNISYSGLKNAVRLLIESIKGDGDNLTLREMQDLSANFENVAHEGLLIKIRKIIRDFEVRTIMLGGGVSANVSLRKKLRSLSIKNDLLFVCPANLKLCTDNAGMIGVAAWVAILRGKKPTVASLVDRKPGLDWNDEI